MLEKTYFSQCPPEQCPLKEMQYNAIENLDLRAKTHPFITCV